VALYRACERAGVRRVVHLTPAGDPAARRSHALAARHYAERKLQSLAIDWVVLAYPEEVALPRLCAAVADALENPEAARRRVTLASPRLQLFYDGACPICNLEMRRLRSLDGDRRLECLDITAPGFEQPARLGATLLELMGRVHALAPDGRLLAGLDAIRAAYAAVGLGWLLAPTRLPLIRRLADRAYLAFARNRHAISRRLGL
jgi:predicted DCC family thiol-disulfide oxidoreductase YuxK